MLEADRFETLLRPVRRHYAEKAARLDAELEASGLRARGLELEPAGGRAGLLAARAGKSSTSRWTPNSAAAASTPVCFMCPATSAFRARDHGISRGCPSVRYASDPDFPEAVRRGVQRSTNNRSSRVDLRNAVNQKFLKSFPRAGFEGDFESGVLPAGYGGLSAIGEEFR